MARDWWSGLSLARRVLFSCGAMMFVLSYEYEHDFCVKHPLLAFIGVVAMILSGDRGFTRWNVRSSVNSCTSWRGKTLQAPIRGVLSVFMEAILERHSPTIFGDSEQSRDFTYVEDVAELNLKAARAENIFGKLYNGGNGDRITLNQAWALLQKMEGVGIPAVYVPPRAGDVRHSQADPTAAVRDLGHNPRFSFEEGMRRTLEWYRAEGRPATGDQTNKIDRPRISDMTSR